MTGAGPGTRRPAQRRLQAEAAGADRTAISTDLPEGLPVSEGVDILRPRVGVYATTAKTTMIFRQIVGRFVRTGIGSGKESWLFLPPEPIPQANAAKIEEELHRVAQRGGAGEEEGWDEPEEPRQSERGPDADADSLAVAADVAEQRFLSSDETEAVLIKEEVRDVCACT